MDVVFELPKGSFPLQNQLRDGAIIPYIDDKHISVLNV